MRWVIAFASCLYGCVNVPPCAVVEDGDKIEIEVVGAFDTTSSSNGYKGYINFEPLPSCEGADSPQTTTTVRMKGSIEKGMSCVTARCPADFPSGPSEPLLFFANPDAGNSVCEAMGRKVSFDGCEVMRSVVIRSLTGDDVFSAAASVVLIRTLYYASEVDGIECKDPLTVFPTGAEDEEYPGVFSCSDAWSVRLKRK